MLLFGKICLFFALYQNYFSLVVDTPFTTAELQLAKTDDRTFVYVAVVTQGTPCR